MENDFFIFGEEKFYNKIEDQIEDILAFDFKELDLAFKKIEKLKEKYFLVGYMSYQAKDYFLNKDKNKKLNKKTSSPLLFFRAFKNKEIFKEEKPQKRNLFIKENITKEEYLSNIEKIKEKIKMGTTYEVNYTFSNDVFSDISGFDLFLSLLQEQKTPYCAYIKNDFDEILSFSPELFFEIKNNIIKTKPMKGTIKREGKDKEEIEFLKNDIKNKAENTMIVDLIRNDLSKIEASFDIKTTKLFEIETHKTLHQMTSSVEAKLKNINLKDILSCLFPCGSITGAPKISTMEVIDKIENYKRNVYCGLIGVVFKDEIKFSVPIRILEKNLLKEEKKYLFSQGGAIVWRSKAEEEYEECKTKKLFLGNSIDFDLIETVLIQNGTPQRYFEHLKRLKNSAKVFGFKYNESLEKLHFENNKIARILLSKNGDFEIEYRDFIKDKINNITLSKEKLSSNNSFLYHKTTFKPWYEKAYQKIKNKEVFDILFLNEKEELTEGARSNIFILKNGILYTPKSSSGLLKGIYRQKIIKEKNAVEKILYLEDLFSAQKIYMTNSIRGIREVRLEQF